MRPAKAKLREQHGTVGVYSVACARCDRGRVQVAKRDTVVRNGERVAVIANALCGACAGARSGTALAFPPRAEKVS